MIGSAISGITTSLEHANSALQMTPDLRVLQIEAASSGGVAQSQVEYAIKGLRRFVDDVSMASEYSNDALRDSEQVVHIYTHAKATSGPDMDNAENMAQAIAGNMYVANDKRKDAIKGAASPIASLEAALDSFDLFKNKLEGAIDRVERQDGIGTEIQKARTAVIEIMPNSEGLTGVGSYLTTLKSAHSTSEQQLQHLRTAESQVPSDSQLITTTIDRVRKAVELLESAEDKNIKDFTELLVRARAEITGEDIYDLKNLGESIKKSVHEIQESGAETVQFQEITDQALTLGRQVLAKL